MKNNKIKYWDGSYLLIEWYEYFEKYPNSEPITIQRRGMDFDHYFVLYVDKNYPETVLCDMHVSDFEFLQYVPSYNELISLGWVKIEVWEEENDDV